MRALAVSLGAGLLCTVLGTSAHAEPRRYALVIGNNLSESIDTPQLRYADDDAIATHEMLRDAGVESVLLVRPDADTARLHPTIAAAGPPTAGNLRRAYAGLRRQMMRQRGETELLLFYSGHGDVDGGEGYILLEDRRLTRTVLHQDILAVSPATRNHVFIDACKSYFVAFERGPGGRRRAYTGSLSSTSSAALDNTGFVLSTASDRDSHEWERFQAGIFSYELRSALRGGADVDGDRRVTYAELGAFLRAANSKIPNARFRPEFVVKPPRDELELPVLRWRDDRHALLFDDAGIGHVYIETPEGVRLMDVHVAAGETRLLHLPDPRPLYVRTRDERTELVITAAGTGRLSALTRTGAVIASRGALHRAFSSIFAAPFGRPDLDSYRARAHLAEERRLALIPAGDVTRERVERAAGYTALAAGAVATAAALGSLGMELHAARSDSSQRHLAELAETQRTVNLVGYVSGAIAATAAATWLTARLWPRADEDDWSLTVVPDAEGASVRIGWEF